jgi:hypothetical protein
VTLIVPGTWIEPVDPHMRWQGPRIFGHPIFIDVPLKPYICKGLILTEVECPSCRNNGGVWIKVKEFPLVAFCPTHWQPIRQSSAVADLKELLGVT